jgi:hypothetical protein
MDQKQPAPTKDEWAAVGSEAAKASFDALIEQLRAAPRQPALRDQANAIRGWSTLDRVLVAVTIGALIALAVVHVAFWR